jgi:soluble lytic murein transglycosylase-like protein
MCRLGMTNLEGSLCALTVACLFLSPLRARAERIVLVDDGNGHMVYVNVEDPPAKPTGLRQAILRQPKAAIEQFVEKSAKKHQVDPKLVRAVIQVESDYDTQAVSNKGAMGLMQLMPATAQQLGVEDPFSASQNIEGGVNYLKYLLDLFGGDISMSLAAYNAGEGRVLRRGGVPQIPETVNYVQKVRSLYDPEGKIKRAEARDKPAPPVTIYRYVDAHGVVHYTDGSDL